MAAKKAKAALKLGVSHTLTIKHIQGRKEEIDEEGQIVVIEEGDTHRIELDHREAKTSERIQYMGKSAALAKKIETEQGIRGIMDLRLEYGKKVFLVQRGLEFPEGVKDEEGMDEWGSEYLMVLAQHVFEGSGAAEVSIDDAGKSERTSAISLKDVSAQ